jgi:hypothetical protein
LWGALEKALADALTNAGYDVMNTVRWKSPLIEEHWTGVKNAFAKHFPNLRVA